MSAIAPVPLMMPKIGTDKLFLKLISGHIIKMLLFGQWQRGWLGTGSSPRSFPIGPREQAQMRRPAMPWNAGDYLAKANKCELHAASASDDALKHQFHDIAKQWRKLAEQADRHAYQDALALGAAL
jgi:hypothetical protein